MTDLLPTEVHARLVATANQLSIQWFGKWKEDPITTHIELGFQKTLEDLQLIPVVISHMETCLGIYLEIDGQWGEFHIDYATGKVGKWQPDEN